MDGWQERDTLLEHSTEQQVGVASRGTFLAAEVAVELADQGIAHLFLADSGRVAFLSEIGGGWNKKWPEPRAYI
jgi:hypothetical protein